MKLTSKILILIFISFISCNKDSYIEPDNSGGVSSPPQGNNNTTMGSNLFINNELDDKLLLYSEDEFVKEIPEKTENYPIEIQTDGRFSKMLKLWKNVDVTDRNEPDLNLVFRQWEVVLPETSSDESLSAVWYIEKDTINATGTIHFSYPDTGLNNIPNFYSLDIFLNNKVGSKFISLASGTVDKMIGIDYGSHTLIFNYWNSNQNSNTGREDVGCLQVNENGEDFRVILNYNFPNKIVEIPIFYFSSIGRKGSITFHNNTEDDVQVFTNGDIIENIVCSDNPTQAISYILKDSQDIEFLIPEDEYSFGIYYVNENSPFEMKNLRIIELYPFEWNLDGANNYHPIKITNQTGKRFTLHDRSTGKYIGFWLDDGESISIEIEDGISELEVRDWLGSGKAETDNVLSDWTVTELN